MANSYAQALWNIAKDDTHPHKGDAKKLVEHLTTQLTKEGRLKLLPVILRDFRKLAARHAKMTPLVEVAHEREAKQALAYAAAVGIHAERAVVNESLIKGWRASGNGILLDHSAKQQLVELYRNITT